MKHITKGDEPHSLIQHRQQANSNYDNYTAKSDLRDALLAEQGGICCYCMRRITAQNMKIEHWACRDTHPQRQLQYRNLLAACDGGEGAANHLQHCDTHKGTSDIKIHPADPVHDCETFIKYQADGVIYSNDAQINDDLDEVLNLNLQRMCDNRQAVLDGAMASLRKKRPDGAWTKAFLQGEKQRWSSRNHAGQFREYCQIVSYQLDKKIAKAATI
jgi:uncharacterized protein (TIGR02646 family)